MLIGGRPNWNPNLDLLMVMPVPIGQRAERQQLLEGRRGTGHGYRKDLHSEGLVPFGRFTVEDNCPFHNQCLQLISEGSQSCAVADTGRKV